jgi:hypothetical protein
VETETPGHGPAYRFWRWVNGELKRRSMSQNELARAANEYLQRERPEVPLDRDEQLDGMKILRLKTTKPRDEQFAQFRREQVRAIAAVLDLPEAEALELAGLVAPTSATADDAIDAITRVDARELSAVQKASIIELVEKMRDLNAQTQRTDHGEDRRPDTA